MLHPDALGWTLLHFCWQATVIALLHGAIDLALRDIGSRARYGLALAALLGMAAVAGVTLIHQEGLARVAMASTAVAGRGGLLLGHDGAAAFGYTVHPALRLRYDTGAVLLWLDALWFLGVSLLSVRAIGGWLMLRRVVRAADADLPGPVLDMVDRLGRRLGLARPVSVRLSWRTASPFVMGLFRAVLVIPVSTLTALSTEQLEAVLAHELAHIRRADYFWNILQTLLETLFFFHPAVWWIGRRLREERELCCDDMAVSACGNPLAYATALYVLEAGRGNTSPLALALDGHRPVSALRLRIAHVLGEPSRPSGRAAPLMLVGAAAAGLSLFSILPGAAAIVPATRTPSVPVATVPRAPGFALAARVSAKVWPAPPSPSPRPSLPGAASPAPAAGPTPQGYAEAMAAAGYVDNARALGWLQEMGVTPDYVRSIVALGLGVPNAKQIRILWEHGTRPAEFYRALQAAGGAPTTLYDFVGYSLYGVTPALITGMREAGFDDIPSGRLVKLARLGVTPAYARAAKQAQPDIDSWHLVHQVMLGTYGLGIGWSGDG